MSQGTAEYLRSDTAEDACRHESASNASATSSRISSLQQKVVRLEKELALQVRAQNQKARQEALRILANERKAAKEAAARRMRLDGLRQDRKAKKLEARKHAKAERGEVRNARGESKGC